MKFVTPRQEMAYFWDCPECGAANPIDFMHSDEVVACSECGEESHVDSTTRAEPERNLDI